MELLNSILFVWRCKMTIQQVCKQSGLSVDTIRYYERIGLVEAEKGAYFKNYSQQALETLVAIKKLRLAGLTLHEIKWLLSIEEEPKDLSPKQINAVFAVIENALERAKNLAKEISESQKLLSEMKNKLSEVSNEDM